MVVSLHRRSSLLGLVVPLALLAGQLSTVAHSMLVEHQRCPEHGELVHRAQRGTTAPPAGLVVAPRAVHQQVLAPATAIERDGDDHCVSLAGRREVAGPPPRSSGDLAFPTREAVAGDRSASLHDCDALLLRLAPKTSPPRWV